MALHFSANQYEHNFEAKLLQNWEVPDTFRLRPRALRGYTRIISNDSGHLSPGVKRSRVSPWGTFIGTWDMPLKIPGNHMTNWTARSTGAQDRLQRMKTDGDIVLQGKLKNCKIPSPLPIKGDDPLITTFTPEKPASSRLRSGAKNPEPNGLYKSVTPVKSMSPVPVQVRQLTPMNTPKLDWPRPGSRTRSALPNISQNAMSPKLTDGCEYRYDPQHEILMQERSSKSPIVWPAPKTTQYEV